MPVNSQGYWVPNIAPKQFEVFNNYSRFTLLSGPRKSAKTFAVHHKVMRHAWEVGPRARVGVFVKTIKNARVGHWDTLYNVIAMEWEGMRGFKITKPMSMDPSTKMSYFRVSNQYGGESEFQLHSLDHENEIEAKMKGTEFSAIWISELTNFRDRKIFDLTKEQLRMPGVPYDQHMWISDTNPDEDDGDQFWAYKIWYEERVQESHPYPNFQKQLKLIEFSIDDNPFLDPREKEDLMASYRGDPDLWAVYIDGVWLQTSKDSLFTGIFSKARHTVGGDDELLPEEDCSELITGWDPGDINLSCHILEKVQTPSGITWKILDELIWLDTQSSLADFAIAVTEMMDKIEAIHGKKKWLHYSDDQAVNRHRSLSGTFDQMEIYEATGGRIRVEGVPKFSGSQRLRAKLMRQLLVENRMFISDKCQALIDSLNGGLKKSKLKSEYIKSNKHKHPFDSVTYAIQAESAFDLMFTDEPRIVQAGVSIRL